MKGAGSLSSNPQPVTAKPGCPLALKGGVAGLGETSLSPNPIDQPCADWMRTMIWLTDEDQGMPTLGTPAVEIT